MALNDIKICIIILLLFIMIICIFGDTGSKEGNLEGFASQTINHEAITNILSLTGSNEVTFNDPSVTNIDASSLGYLYPTEGKLCTQNVCVNDQNLKSILLRYQIPTNKFPTDPYIYSTVGSDSIVYDDIFNAIQLDVVKIPVSRYGYSDETFKISGWNGFNIVRIGTFNDLGYNASITVPSGMDVMWIRVLNDRVSSFSIDSVTSYSCGSRNLFKIKPNGLEDLGTLHRWVPCPVNRDLRYKWSASYTYQVRGLQAPYSQDSITWISGVGFSKNPNSHAMFSAETYALGLNGTMGVTLDQTNQANVSDRVGIIEIGNHSLRVPVITSGKNKMLYLLTNNTQSYFTRQLTSFAVTVNGIKIENFRKYDNTFSRYYNSKPNVTYYGAKIPADIVDSNHEDTRFPDLLTVTLKALLGVELATTFIEIGSHDF